MTKRQAQFTTIIGGQQVAVTPQSASRAPGGAGATFHAIPAGVDGGRAAAADLLERLPVGGPLGQGLGQGPVKDSRDGKGVGMTEAAGVDLTGGGQIGLFDEGAAGVV